MSGHRALKANCWPLQEAGKENLFTFGVDAEEVDQLREDRKDFKDYDPRWTEAFKLIYDGTFGDKEYFKVSPAATGCCP